MKLLHRHIFASVALTSLAAVLVLVFVLVLGNVVKELLGYLLAGQISPGIFLRLLWLLVPFAMVEALPMAMLTGVLLVLGRMSADREITAIRSAGVSIAGISAPIFVFALLGVALSASVNFYFMPVTRLAFKQEKADAIRNNPRSFIVPKTFIRDFPGVVIYASENQGDLMKDFWFWKLDKQNRAVLSGHAASARIEFDEPNNKLLVTLHDARIEERHKQDPEDYSVLIGPKTGSQFPIELSLDQLTGKQSVNVIHKWKTLTELLDEWNALGKPSATMSDLERRNLRIKIQTVIQEKAAKAFSVLSFALIAIPLGIKVSRKETSANLGVALALAMGYYFSTVMVGWIDSKPEFRPDLLMWLPNLGFQALGITLFYKADRG